MFHFILVFLKDLAEAFFLLLIGSTHKITFTREFLQDGDSGMEKGIMAKEHLCVNYISEVRRCQQVALIQLPGIKTLGAT